MRRNASRMRRLGIQPIAPMTDDLGLAPLIITSIGRQLWRYRSELAPITLALLTLLAGALMRHYWPTWWPTVLLLTGAIAGAIALLGSWVNLTRPIERGYATVTCLFLGCWVTAATFAGPLTTPLPAVLTVGGALLALPWWAHRRRRARVRVERTLAAWPEIADAVGLAGSRVQSAIVDLWGYRFRLALGRGQTVEDAISRTPALESALGSRRGAVRIQPVPTKHAHRADVRVIETDPHAGAINWPGPAITSVAQPAKLGLFEDGSPVRVPLLHRHALIGGVAGGGKSGGVNVLLGDLTACPDVIVWGVDLKGGMELRPWASCLGRLATTPQEAEALLADAVVILDARADHLAQQGVRLWDPTPRMPALVVLIDEYAELVDDAPNAVRHADSVARRGRAVAVQLIAATQRPSQKAMGKGAVRSQMDVRLSFRVREQRDVDLILGQGMLKAGWHAHRLDAPGKFFLSSPENDAPRRARTYLLDDTTVQVTAARHVPDRPSLDAVSVAALENAAERAQSRMQPADRATSNRAHTAHHNAVHDPEIALAEALADAPPEGISVDDLIRSTDMGRSWVYARLREHVRYDRASQVTRGRWRSLPDRHDL
ncbi:cell division protein FtsK [Nonomuraea sp. NPDC050310]|uniref:cell division protein FtsK n=1 Tax=Nonomuraea sp. NPDC050310 TaxID=3154935 RepID=UPI0033FE169D